MKISKLMFSILVFFVVFSASAQPTSNAVDYPEGWQNWATIAVSYRADNNTSRVILGNEVAVKAARSGQTNPWPDGTIIGKVVWKSEDLASWQAAKVPAEFVHAEFMFKNAKAENKTGWNWARWIGLEQKPYNEGDNSCIACHTPVKGRDWVFTEPALLPK